MARRPSPGNVHAMSETYTVGIVGLGAIGLELARALDKGVPGLKLTAVAVRDAEKARAAMKDFKDRPLILDIAKLPRECDIIVEAAPSAIFEEVATAAIESAVADPARLVRVHGRGASALVRALLAWASAEEGA